MLKKQIADLLNEQINKEFYSAYLYLEMNNYFQKRGLDGFANWFYVQAQEERDHAMLIYQYMHDENASVTLQLVGQPATVFRSDMDVLKEALRHEEYVTASINAIYKETVAANDYRTKCFLDWFISEQGEEELNARNLITRMELFGSECKGLYALNCELGKRKYESPQIKNL